MPWNARRPCRALGCANLSERGSAYCAQHYKQTPTYEQRRAYDRDRGTAHQRGYTAEWRVARRAFLKDNPLCVKCWAEGRIEPATVVDHVTPHRGDMRLFWDANNWQALCKTCHDRKTASGQ